VSLELYFAFVLATALLIVFPGPNVTLIVAAGMKDGRRAALLTVAGSNLGLAGQLTLAILGMTSVMIWLADWFEWLRWIGVAYLVWLGLRQWRHSIWRPAPALAEPLPELAPARGRGRRSFFRGLVVAVLNPKTLMFHIAFLPQFVDPSATAFGQLLLLGLTFLAIAAVLDSTYALLASRAGGLLRRAADARWTDRVTGSLLIGAGIGLALARRG
jgi:homoserine/homoserine lactone efflux protein